MTCGHDLTSALLRAETLGWTDQRQPQEDTLSRKSARITRKLRALRDDLEPDMSLRECATWLVHRLDWHRRALFDRPHLESRAQVAAKYLEERNKRRVRKERRIRQEAP